jgi:alpha-tubulin suppressor-like RCC1 family protein/uncharacterized protein YjbI with pentapeptide repeats
VSRHVPTRRVAAVAVAVALGLLVAPESVRAQIAGDSVNMVTGTEWPGGDPYLQRQNEPSIAVSSANPEHLLAGANDYRTVDIAKAPADKMAGDAWAGIFKSLDGGKTWKSYLMPGYPQDPARYSKVAPYPKLTGSSAPPLMWCGVPTAAVAEVRDAKGVVTTAAVPATDGTCTSAADPVVRAGADGMFYFGGITFQRFTNYGKVYLARFIDLNNKENGNATQGTDPIRFIDQKVVAIGSATDFVDKPWIAIDVPRPNAPTCSVTVVNPDKTTTQRSFPGHTIYVAYLRLTANQTQSDVMVRHSDDCGTTWSAAVKVNDATSLANEGPALAIDPVKGHVYVTWRRVRTTDAAGAVLQTNAIMISRSFSRANKFTKPREVATVSPFDQTTTDTGFRVTLFPSSAISVDPAGARRLHVAWAERVDASNDARVVVATKLLSPPPVTEREEDEDDKTCQKLDRARAVDGAPITVDATPIPGRGVGSFGRGHQFMPAITFSQGKLMLVYYDSRLDHTRAYFKPNVPFTADATGAFYEVIRGPLGAPPVSKENIPVGADTQLDSDADVFNAFVDDGNLTMVRHTVDVRVASADPSDAPAFTPAPLSKFPFGTRGDEAYLKDASGNLMVPGFGADLQVVAGNEIQLLQQLKVNPPNLPMFKGGTKPFFGDYIDVQGPAFVKKAGKWVFNNDFNPSPVFHAVWTSNEDVKAPPDGKWDLYAPINVQGASRVDPTQQTVACTPATALYAASRNQNIYTARITDGLMVSSPQNTKPLSSTQVRSFVIAAHNATSAKKTVKFTYTIPTGVTASFQALPNNQLATLPSVVADIAPHSTVSRSLFVKSSNASATITATVTEQGGALASGFVLLNPPGATPGLIAPDGASAITGGETYTPIQVAANLSNANLSNANLSNANLSNANLSTANLSNANLSNANLSNANLSNAALANLSNANLSNANLSNANLSNANLSNANLSNANLSNANLSNANLSNASLSDLNYEYQNTGNTSTAYSVRLVGTKPAAGEVLQLIIAKTYTTPTAVGCDLKEEAHNHILASIDDVSGAVVDATSKVNPGVGDASVANATLVLAPGEKAQITLRGNVTLARMAEIGSKLAPRPVPQQTPIGGTNGTTTYAQYTPRASTTTTLSYDGSAVFTATVRDAASAVVASGSVNFVANGNLFLETVPLGATGTATLTPTGLPSGSTVAAYYSGANAYLPSQASLTTTAINVTVNPASVTLAPGAQRTFSAAVTGTPDTTVTWSVDETGAGTISNAGVYIAHAVPGTYHVRATSSVDTTKSGTATVIVSNTIDVLNVSPAAPVLVVGDAQAFTASVNGAIIPGVIWSVSPATGATITAGGGFVASSVGTFTVTATSAAGTLSASATFTVSAAVPGAPTLLMVTGAGNGQVSLAWSPPASDGGSPVAGYKVTVTSAAGSFVRDVGMTTTATVGSLTNGIAHTFTVAAYNGVGAGTGPSSNSATATPVAPVTAPDAPTGVTATVGNQSASITWLPPASNGGSPITGYGIIIAPPVTDIVLNFNGTTATVSGLGNGTAYTFSVTATNAVGTSPESAPSSPVTPYTVPGVPIGVVANAGNQSVSLTWTAPPWNGGRPITGYAVSISPAVPGALVNVNGTSASVTGLANGTPYTFTVSAINLAGTGAPSAPTGWITPFTVPDAPTGLTATAGNGSATLGWTAPASDGGSPGTGYTVAISPAAGSVVVSGTTAAVTGLTNGTAYTFTVAAINGAGTGPASSPSSPFTPIAPVTVGTFAIGGAINDGYVVVRVDKNGASFSGATVTLVSGATTVTVPNIGGFTYSTNAFTLPASGQSVTVTVTDGVNTATGSATVPGRPTITAPTAGSSIPAASPLTVAWTLTPAAPDPVRFKVEGFCTLPCSSGSWKSEAATARSSTLGAGFFPAGTGVEMAVYAVNDLPLTGNVVTGSGLVVNAKAPTSGYLNFNAAAAPGAPTSVVATAGIQSASLSWTAPVSNGGSAITGYAVASTPAAPAGAAVSVVGTSATVTGLAAGTAYTFTVSAINLAGTGTASAPSNAVTPTGPARLRVSAAIGASPTESMQIVHVWDEAGADVPDAVVMVEWTINGATNTVPLTGANGWYNANPQVAWPEGTAVRLIVTRGIGPGSSRVEAQGVMPGLATISAPAAGAQVPFDRPVTVNWSGAFSGATTEFVVYVDQGPVNLYQSVRASNVFSQAIPAGTIPVGATADLRVYSMRYPGLTGDFVPGPSTVELYRFSAPVAVTGAAPFVAPLQARSTVAAGGSSTFFLMTSAWAMALGKNDGGQLGTNAAIGTVFPVPAQVTTESFMSIDAAAWYGMAISNGGALYAWGYGPSIGQPTFDNPQPLPYGKYGMNIDAISAGYNGGLALRSDGQVFWIGGDDHWGQAGPPTGPTTGRVVPGLSGIVAVAAGETHSLALASDGTVWSLGDNQFGQLGDGTNTPSTTPRQVVGLDRVVAIVAGSWFSVALRDDGTVWTWGFNGNGALGNGTAADSSMPAQVSGLTGVTAIATGNNHTLAILADRTVRAWGYNGFGQLGNGSYVSNAIPVAVPLLADVIEVSGGERHSVARRADGTIWAWGQNAEGQLGTGAGANSPVPVQIGAVTVTVTPGTASLTFGQTQTFTAVAAGAFNQAVTWSVQETGGGTISAAGLYTAPSTAGTYTVRAESVADPTKSGTAIVTTAAPGVVTVAIVPLAVDPTVGTPLTISATVTGSTNTGVTWSVSPAGATIAQDGSFLATVRGNYTVTATSQADPTKSASTVVTAWGPFFTTFTLAITPSPSGFADPVSMTAAFTAPYDWPQPTGTVTFSDNLAWGFEFTPVTLPFTCTRSPATLSSPWECSVTISPAPAWVRAGGHRVYADYNGDAFYDTSWAQFDTDVLNPAPVLAYLGSVSHYRGGTDHHLKVTNWSQYGSSTFYSDYGAPCAPYSWSAHTQVDVLEGATGALLQGYCLMVKPTDLQDFTFFVADLVAPPTSVKVRMTDRWWNTVTESNVVAVPPPFVAPSEQAASTVAAGGNSTFFLAPGGTAMALGTNLGGQLGTGSVAGEVLPNPTPVAMPGGGAVRSIDAASLHGMAIDVTGSLWTWGFGPAISEPATYNLVPVSRGNVWDYSSSVRVSSISAGYGHGLILMSNGDVWGVGDDQWGQFSGTSYGAIRGVNHPQGVVAVAAGEHHSMLLASDGTVWTLGRNEYGQLGDGTSSGVGSTFTRTTPLPVVGLYQVVAIAAGSFHSVALRSDGTVWTWGRGTDGQLGNGGTADVGRPVQVLGVGGIGLLMNVQRIATGNNHTLALLGDGTLCTWGYNNSGQLGDSSLTNRLSPVAVVGLANITDMAGGELHSVARRSDDTIWAWGLNESSQLGTGAVSGTPSSNSPVPVQVGAVVVNVTPGTASVTAGQTRSFTAVVGGAVDQTVTWSVQEAGGGTISSAGVYTAPSGPGGPYHVVATSVANPGKIGTAIVMVTLPGVWGIGSAAMPTPRFTHAVGTYGTKLYAWGGMTNYSYVNPAMSVDLYDTATGAWETIGTWGNPGFFQAGVQVGSGLYLFGGLTGTSTDTVVATWQEFNLWDFYNDPNPASTWWGPLTVMTTPRASAGAGRLGTATVVSGGYSATGFTVLASAETVNGTQGGTAVAPMSTARYDHAVAVVGSRYYAIGGRNASSAPIAGVEVFDGTNWAAGPSLPIPLFGSATVVLGTKIYVLGGATTGLAVTNAVYVLDTAAPAPAWTAAPPLPVAVAYPGAAVIGGSIYVVGGDIGGGSPAYPYIQMLKP